MTDSLAPHSNPDHEPHEHTAATKISRHDHILQALATMLEQCPGERITTAGLAKKVGVSEAALYRHFPSKAKIFEGLIDFVEETIFSRIAIIHSNQSSANTKCYQTLSLLLTFAEKNPGITRILTGDPLTGENERLRKRVTQFFDRFETQLKQFIRESALDEKETVVMETHLVANLILSTAVGKICQYVRSDFDCLPTNHWDEQWQTLGAALFKTKGPG